MRVVCQSDAWARLISCFSSLMHVLLTVFAGFLVSSLVSGRQDMNPLVFVFAAASKLFAVAFTEKMNGSRKMRIYSAAAFACLLFLLMGLAPFEIVIGVLILMLYCLYPVVDGKAPFDVMHHVFRYVFIFILGYWSQAFFNGTALLAILAIALFSVAGELLAGLGKDGGARKGAASLLGIRRSLIAVVSSVFIASLLSAFVFNDLFEFPIPIYDVSIPFYVIPALVIDVFLTLPMMKALNGKSLDPFRLTRRKELIAVFIAALLILAVLQAERIGTVVAVDSSNYSFDVGIRTFIAGPNDWDVPWIIFDYVDEGNYYYVVFHKNGVLELSQMSNGQMLNYQSSVKTRMSPFQWHNFRVLLNKTTIVVTLDGKYQVSTARRSAYDRSSVKVSAQNSSVLCLCTINISQ